MNAEEQKSGYTLPNDQAAEVEEKTSGIQNVVSELYEEVLISPTFRKDNGAKSTIKIPYYIDLVALVLGTRSLYKILKKENSAHEILKVKFKFTGVEDSEDMLTITYDPRPEDELKYGKHLVTALLNYGMELYDTVNA